MYTGVHLHFEVGVPDDASNPVNGGGFIIGRERIPVFCDIPGNILFQGNTVTANPCSSNCADTNVLNGTFGPGSNISVMANDTITTPENSGGTAIFMQGANTILRSNDVIDLLPGFDAQNGAFFQAKIEPCNN